MSSIMDMFSLAKGEAPSVPDWAEGMSEYADQITLAMALLAALTKIFDPLPGIAMTLVLGSQAYIDAMKQFNVACNPGSSDFDRTAATEAGTAVLRAAQEILDLRLNVGAAEAIPEKTIPPTRKHRYQK